MLEVGTHLVELPYPVIRSPGGNLEAFDRMAAEAAIGPNQLLAQVQPLGTLNLPLVIVALGAARAGTTLLSYFEIGDQIDFLVDDNKNKHYKFSPGDKLEVFPTSDIYLKKPHYLLILAWLHADKIIQSHKKYLDEGGIFLRLFPGVTKVKK